MNQKSTSDFASAFLIHICMDLRLFKLLKIRSLFVIILL